MKYFSSADIGAIQLPHRETEALVVEAFRAARAGRVSMPARTSVAIPSGARFVSFPSAVFSGEDSVGALKWVGISASQSGRHHLEAVLLLSDPVSGELRAILDAQWITLWRTATVTLVAAKRCADPRSGSAAFLACGQQAEAHLELLCGAFPLREVRAYSRTLETAEDFARRARARGLAASSHSTMEECVEGADIVVSSLPGRPADGSSCRADWFTANCFVALVDLGRTFEADPGRGFDNTVVDDAAQYEALQAGGLIARVPGPIVELGELLDRPAPAASGRTLFIPTGCGYLDAVLGLRLAERAQARGLGTPLST